MIDTMTLKYTEEKLRNEINDVLERLRARGEVLQPQWITQEICQRHRSGLASTADAEYHIAFWEFSGYTLTRKLTTRCINDLDDAADQRAAKPLLPGFEFLQRHYVINRDGVDVGVPIEESTDAELLAKAALYRAQSTRLLAHADELDRYVELRRARRQASGE